MKPSPEQSAVVDRVVTGSSLDVLAYAGTGKTSCLLQCALAIPQRRVLYVAFNAHNAREAKTRFRKDARHVRVSTYHGLAFGPVGSRYAEAGRLVQGAWQVRRAMTDRFASHLTGLSRFRLDAIVYAALDGLRAFCQSADRALSLEHVPPTFVATATEDDSKVALQLMQRTWEAMMSQSDAFPITHDVYFKKWLLSRPHLNYDVILVDERQDVDAAMLDLMRTQNTQLVFCGDSYQSLYGFRGAIGNDVDLGLPQMPLTHSWRFGSEIAAEADQVLRVREAFHPLVGAGPSGRVLGYGGVPKVVLCRSNCGVVTQALAWMEYGKKVGIIGGAAEVADTIEGAYDMYASGSSRHPRFRFFESWGALVEAAGTKQGQDLRPFVKLVTNYGSRVPRLVAQIKSGTVSVESADVVLSTVHKFKGMEAESVLLADDFQPFVEIVENRAVVDVDEANVAYVALTRAQTELQLGAFARPFRESLAIVEQIRTMARAQAELPLETGAQVAASETSPATVLTKPVPESYDTRFGLWSWDAAS